MAKKPTPIMVVPCVVCGETRSCAYSLRVTRSKKEWHSNPVCPNCRWELIKEAKQDGQFIPFFPINNSVREVEKRNSRVASHRPFLEKFGQKRKVKPGKARPSASAQHANS